MEKTITLDSLKELMKNTNNNVSKAHKIFVKENKDEISLATFRNILERAGILEAKKRIKYVIEK
ncbi:MAG: hypothetical protein EOM78_11755 [Erysipelotrichia bacterium]|nr:hypothetical protein [Erysipelotrichia bacterium]